MVTFPIHLTIERLPAEVLGIIFGIATQASHNTLPLASRAALGRRAILTAYRIACVNKRWRDVALQHSRIWTSVALILSDLDDWGALPDHLYVSHKRSRHMDLNLNIDLRTHSPSTPPGWWSLPIQPIPPPKDQIRRITLWLRRGAPRWNTCSVATNSVDTMNTFLRHISTRSNYRQLRDVSLACDQTYHPCITHTAPYRSELDTPRLYATLMVTSLTTLTLTGIPLSWPIFTRVLKKRCQQLRTLSLSYIDCTLAPTLFELHAVLRSVRKQLTHLSLRLHVPFEETLSRPPIGPIPTKPVVLNHLESFKLNFVESGDVHHILSIFSAPNVLELELEDSTPLGGPKCSDSSHALQALHCSPLDVPRFPSIHTLVLRNIGAGYLAFRGLFVTARQIETLRLFQPTSLTLMALMPHAIARPAKYPADLPAEEVELWMRPAPLLVHLEVSATPNHAARIAALEIARADAGMPLKTLKSTPLGVPFAVAVVPNKVPRLQVGGWDFGIRPGKPQNAQLGVLPDFNLDAYVGQFQDKDQNSAGEGSSSSDHDEEACLEEPSRNTVAAWWEEVGMDLPPLGDLDPEDPETYFPPPLY